MPCQSFKYFLSLLRSDLHRYAGNARVSSFLYHFLLEPGYIYTFWMRTCAYLKSVPLLNIFVFPLCWLILHRCEIKYGISISYRTQIGHGFYIGHFDGIVVNPMVVIGKNCNISHGVTLGVANRGERKGCPTIGANCVVTQDVPDFGVVVGVPGRVFSLDGSEGYINQTNYE